MQAKGDWFLTYDIQVKYFAESLGLEVHGSIGLLLWAAAVGHLQNREHAHRLLDGLVHSSLWISGRVAQKAGKAIDELLQE